MATAACFLFDIPRYQRVLRHIGVALTLAGLSGVGVTFLLYAYMSLWQLQQMSPDQLIRALSGCT
jgi:hypothetical protein